MGQGRGGYSPWGHKSRTQLSRHWLAGWRKPRFLASNKPGAPFPPEPSENCGELLPGMAPWQDGEPKPDHHPSILPAVGSQNPAPAELWW